MKGQAMHRFVPHPAHASRFAPATIYAMFLGRKVDPMDSEPRDSLHESDTHVPPLPKPRARDWLWRPFYAKAWWAGIAAYWGGAAASLKLPALADFYTSTLAGFFNIAFYPLVALIILGLGYVRTWFAWSDWEWVEPTQDQLFPKRSVGGFRDPMADPLDPRSPSHWRYLNDIN